MLEVAQLIPVQSIGELQIELWWAILETQILVHLYNEMCKSCRKKLLRLIISSKSDKCAGFRHVTCSLYVAYALLQNTLTVFKYTVRLFVLTEGGKQ